MSVKVTVVILTYNHERFIEQALESVLNQERSFPIRIIVADDGSTDKTVQLVEKYRQADPDSICLLEKSTNQGVKSNIISCLSEIRGEYIAVLDGDDYWSNTKKLAIQVDFLDNNPDFNGVFHDAEIIHVDTAQSVLFNQKKYYSQSYVFKDVIFPSDLLSRKMILPSSSALLRSSSLQSVDTTILSDNYSILWKLTCIAIRWSKFYFINEVMSVYHNHQKGISKSNNEAFHNSHIQFLHRLLTDECYKNYKYDIYLAVSNEYKILLDSKQNNLNKKQLFRKYIGSEIRKIKHYRKSLFKK